MVSKLKSLEVQGYKTFASRTLFEFPGQVTAIVGPNGSGKSNIADAIRWVLGEQSYSLLRGRKTEDMIFSGSEQRPRASMASVAITFDNEDGWLPIDYSEVSISRRASRDGQNDYVLNGQRVRLKETSELLAQSGLAERTYTIIGQGLVDAALSLRPEERRRFFEEAAGIGLYRSRREDALNRLENTRRNLERVHDILSELEPRLRSLEKQAARFIENERIKADLQVLLRDWYGFHWHRTQRDIGKAREMLQTQEKGLSSARQRLEDVELRIKAQRDKLFHLRTQLSSAHAQSALLHQEREGVIRTLAVLDERQRAFRSQQNTAQIDLVKLQEEEKVMLERSVDLESEVERLNKEFNEAEINAISARENLSARQNERKTIEDALQTARQNHISLETQQVELRARLSELDNRVATLTQNRDNVQKNLETNENNLKQLESDLSRVKNVLAEKETVYQNAEEKLHNTLTLVNESENNYKTLQERTNSFKSISTRLNAQLEVLEQAERSLSGLNRGTQTLFDAVTKGTLSGSYQTISNLIDIPADYEIAIAAVLGEILEGVRLSEGTDPEDALKLLESGEKGRAILFPVQWVKVESKLSKIKDPDILGIAADLISVSSDNRKLVDMLLGQVLLVCDRAAARRIAPTLGHATRVVTLQGEVFSGSGMIIAGKEERANVIARPRQIRELQAKIAKTNQELVEAQIELTSSIQQLEELHRAQKEQQKELRDAEQEVAEANRLVQKTIMQVDQLSQTCGWYRGQIATLKEQLNQTQRDKSDSQDIQREKAKEVIALVEKINSYQSQLSQLPTEDLQAAAIYWDTQKALAERSLKEGSLRFTEQSRTLVFNRERQILLTTRLEETETELIKLTEEKSSKHGEENSLNHKIELSRQEIEPFEKESVQIDAQYEQLQGDQQAAQQAVTVAERHTTQAQLELTRLRDHLESLRGKIEDDFGLVHFEYTSEISGANPLPLDGMVAQLPVLVEMPADLDEQINRQRSALRRLGVINPEAHTEYLSVKERYDFMTAQVTDLRKADEDLRVVITELDELMRREFRKTFDAVAAEFHTMFTRLFGGGSAKLILEDDADPTMTGIDIEARLPGRRETGLSLLSGGERSLTAVALIFSLLKVSPTPFCVLDEVDAMLDEANVGRFTDLLKELSQKTQFVVITHNRNTVQVADVIYGVTMGKDSASQVISLKLDEVGEELVK
jgi:chromosome segregation protein